MESGGRIETDEELIGKIEEILSRLGSGHQPRKAEMTGKIDTYKVDRTVLPLQLSVQTDVTDGKSRTYYLDSGFSESDFKERLSDYDLLRNTLDSIAEALSIKPSCLQMMITKGVTDARYLKEGRYILANLVRYSTNKSKFFWLVTIAREIAYSFAGRLSYQHQNLMRKVIIAALSRWEEYASRQSQNHRETIAVPTVPSDCALGQREKSMRLVESKASRPPTT
jgi:hypothetical protein